MSENAADSGKPMKEMWSKEEKAVVTIQDNSWSEPQSLRQVQETLLNFIFLLHLLWPAHQSGNITGGLLKYWNILVVQDSRTTRQQWFVHIPMLCIDWMLRELQLKLVLCVMKSIRKFWRKPSQLMDFDQRSHTTAPVA